MPVAKQTTELIFSLRALLFRIRQLTKERQGYSKAKHRELAKLLKEGRDDFARIKTEDVIANDNLIAALEIVELYCEQLHVRANILDHLAFNQKRKHVRQKSKPGVKGTGPSSSKAGGGGGGNSSGGGGGGGWGVWKLFGYSSNSPQSEGTATTATTTQQQKSGAQNLEDANTAGDQGTGSKEDITAEDTEDYEVYIDPELDQAAAVIFYSYTHIPRDIPGLPEVRAKLALRWGNDFASKVQDDESPVKLPEELVSRLRVQKAPESLVEMYLKEIARSHGIPWGQDPESEGEEGEGEPEPPGKKHQSTDMPTVVPGLEPSRSIGGETGSNKPLVTGDSESNSSGIPEIDELARRFAALKK